ncbi:hypothetical protein V8F20_005002 [Naviculisporaceae sp. PSN 640]
MPRPVRTRKTSRLAAGTVSSATPPAITKPTTAAPSYDRQPSTDLYDVSDNEKERQQKRVEARRALLEMNPDQVNALEDSRRKRDTAMDKLANISSTTKENTVTESASAEENLDSPAIELSRREDAPSTRPARHTDMSGLDLDDSTFGNLDDSLDDSENAIEDTRSGYRSTDTSSFNINLFKRRPRQSSIVGKDDAPIRPSSRGQNTPSISSHLNLGLFKRRAREPSILGTAQKDRSTRPPSRATSVASRTSRNGNITADEDSGPDDESTPLNLAKRRSEAAPSGADATIAMSPTLPTRKRKSGDNLEGGTAKRPALEQEEEEEIIHQSIEVDDHPVIPSTPPIPATCDRFSTPVHDPNDPDMAPPVSSSSEGGSPVVWPSLNALGKTNYNIPKRGARAPSRGPQKTPELDADDNSSILSSPPSLTHSPNYNARPVKPAPPPKKKPTTAPKVTTTADLTSLLPRRRTKQKKGRNNKDPFDLDRDSTEEEVSEDEDHDGDELSVYVNPKNSAKRKQAAKTTKSAHKGKGKEKTTPVNNGKGKEKETATSGRSKRTLRTYGTRDDEEDEDAEEAEIVVGEGTGDEQEHEENGEDQEVEAETSQMMLERLGEELQQAAKKFKEVDKWELSFEEVEESSSPVPEGR